MRMRLVREGYFPMQNVKFIDNLPKPDFKGTKNGGSRQVVNLFFWSKEKALLRLHPNPSVHSIHNQLLH